MAVTGHSGFIAVYDCKITFFVLIVQVNCRFLLYCFVYITFLFTFWGRVQLEVVSALLAEKYKIETAVKEPTVIYLERPLKAASHTIHIEVPPNPFWASIGLSVTPLPPSERWD